MATLTELITRINDALAAALPGSVWQGLAVPVRQQPGQGLTVKNVEVATQAPAFLSDQVPTNGFHRCDDATFSPVAGRGATNRLTKGASCTLLVYSSDLAIAEKVETILMNVPGIEVTGALYDPGRVNAQLLGLDNQTHDVIDRVLIAYSYTATVRVAPCL